MPKIILVGGSGMLGASLHEYLGKKGYELFQINRDKNKSDSNVNFLDKDNLNKTIRNINPEVIINLIAKTDVDDCENNINNAFISNVKPVISLVNVIKDYKNVFFIHISTDQVYSGKGPHCETKINPLNIYSFTKRISEIEALKIPSVILRTNFVGKSKNKIRKSFSDWIVESLKKNENINVFDDLKFSPLHLDSLCKVIEKVIIDKKIGLYNVGSIDGISKADFAVELAKKLKLDLNYINRCSVKTHNFIAKRPKDMRMIVNKFELSYNYKLPSIKDELKKVIFDY